MMHRLIELTGTWVFKGILLLIAFSFIGYEVSGYFSDSGSRSVATVNGKDISQQFVQQRVDQRLRTIRTQLGEQADGIDQLEVVQNVIDEAIRMELLYGAAQGLNLRASPVVLNQVIRNTSAFQELGVFDATRYHTVLNQSGLTAASYESMLAQDMLIKQLQAPFSTVGFKQESMAKRYAAHQKETIDVRRLLLSSSDVTAAPNPSAEELAQLYDTVKGTLVTPEYRHISVLMFDVDGVAGKTKVTDEEVQAYFDTHIDSFREPEKRRVRHILVQDEETAQKLKADIEGGKDFAAVAKASSLDKSNAVKGGDIGFISPREMPEAYDKAAFDLKKGEVSAPVKTAFGYYLIQVTDIQAAADVKLAKVRDKVVAAVKAEKAEEAVYKLVDDADRMLASGASLTDASKEVGGELSVLGFIDPVGLAKDGSIDPLAAEADLIRSAFSLESGEVSVPLELRGNRFAFVQVSEIEPAGVLPLEQVRPQLVDLFKTENTKQRLLAKATQILAKRAQGESLDKLARAENLRAPQVFKAIGRDSQALGLNGDTLAELFSVEEGKVLQRTVNTTRGLAIFEVVKRSRPTPSEEDVVKAETELGNSMRTSLFTQFLNRLYDDANISINQRRLQAIANPEAF